MNDDLVEEYEQEKRFQDVVVDQNNNPLKVFKSTDEQRRFYAELEEERRKGQLPTITREEKKNE